jgi:NAD(P)-dependent dehydrogenase (short-subunit alcohol dehydrogenase family)
MPPITAQSILVIGGSSGIGFAVAQLSLAQGAARVAIASSNPTRVANAVERLKSSFPDHVEGQIKGHVCDLSADDAEVRLEKLFTEVTVGSDGGEKALLDHIIYTAVSPTSVGAKPIQEISRTSILAPAPLNLVVPLLLAKTALPHLKQNMPKSTSSLIFTSGRIADKPIPNWTVSAAYATALQGMTRGLALDLAPLRVRVNLVNPGATDTELWGEEGSARRVGMRELVASTALLGKAGSVEEVAEAYIYLMRDSNATGAIVSSSSGSLLK